MTMREKLIENPFPRVRHKKGWKGSPSSNRGISFSSSANHFIINIQEIPRSLPKIPPFLYTLPENEQEKKIKEKKNNLKNNLRPLTSNGFRNNSSIKAAQLAAMHNRRRPNTAPVAQDETKWALTKNNSNNNNNNNSTDESNGKYFKSERCSAKCSL